MEDVSLPDLVARVSTLPNSSQRMETVGFGMVPEPRWLKKVFIKLQQIEAALETSNY